MAILPLRDKMPELDWIRLHPIDEPIVEELGMRGDFCVPMVDWAGPYYTENAVRIWRKQCGQPGR